MGRKDWNMTCDQWIQLLWSYASSRSFEYRIDLHEIQQRGRELAWLEEQDTLYGSHKVERRQVARMLHEFLRVERKEEDETDVKVAYQLRDLFDCRTCVNHVAQMYCKGIMLPYTAEMPDLIFGMREGMKEEEAREILKRAFDPSLRLRPDQQVVRKEKTSVWNPRISYEQAKNMLQQREHCLFVDVRSKEQYEEWHMESSIHLPVTTILNNPFVLEGNVHDIILIYCERGTKSDLAALCLLEHGYEHVYSFSWRRTPVEED